MGTKPLFDYFQALPEEWQAFIPNFHYMLTDLSRMPEQMIQGKRESEYLRNLFLALKLARNKELVQKNWKKIFTFRESYNQDDRERILFQTLTIYIVNLFDMQQSEVRKLSKDLPASIDSLLAGVPEVLVKEYKRRLLRDIRKEAREEEVKAEMKEAVKPEARQEGLEEKNHDFTLKIIQKFPDWSDAEIAGFVDVTVAFVQQLRLEITTSKAKYPDFR